jgi:sporulation-control protein spo0M
VPDVQIFVSFDGAAPGSVPRYAPGTVVSGVARVRAGSSVKCNHLRIRCLWQTEGRGDRDEGVIETKDVLQGTLNAGEMRDFPFRFELPREPWSYAGHYINIVWGIGVELDVPWASNPKQFTPFVLAPTWAGGGATMR